MNRLDRDSTAAACARHCQLHEACDREGLGALFAEDARHFDPFFGWHEGQTAIAAFLTLTHDALVIRFGPARVRVPYDRIRAVEPSSNPLSSPALSLRRVRIDYDKPNGKGTFVLVSPQDRDGFMQELRRRAGVGG